MADRFFVGQRVITINSGPYDGLLGTVVNGPGHCAYGHNCGRYGVEFDNVLEGLRLWCITPLNMRPIYDGNDPATLTAADDWWRGRVGRVVA